MDTIFDNVPVSDKKRSPSEILAWMRSIQEAQTTGVLRLLNPPDQKMILHHYQGNWMNPDLISSVKSEFSDLADEITQNGEMFLKFIPLSTHGLIHANLLAQAEHGQQEDSFELSNNAPWTFENSGGRTDPYLVKLKWKNAAGSILFNGVSNQPHSLFISENLILDELGISKLIPRQKDDQSCVVTLFSSDPAVDAWRELRLRRSFKLLCDCMLERLEMIAGRVILESFTRVIASFTSAENMDISILKRQLINNEFYRTSQEAAVQYRKVLEEFIEHFSSVLGPRLLLMTMREIYNSLSTDIREDLKFYKILPEEYLP